MQSDLACTPEVQDWQWRIAATMREGIERSYATHPDEVDCVRAIIAAIDATAPLTGRLHPRASYELAVESTFLHGPESQVHFSIGTKSHQRELADLLVLATYVENGTLTYQRACFIQAKRSGTASGRSAARFGIDPWQLALLGSFPEFTGITGVFHGQTHWLRNRSGMLGAYGFLSPPGNFTVVSARILNHLLGGRKSITTKELIPAILSEVGATRGPRPIQHHGCWFDPAHCPECRELAMFLLPSPLLRHHQLHCRRHALGADTPSESVTTCVGLDEFVQSWSGLRLGEVWHAESRTSSDRSLRTCLRSLVSRVVEDTGALSGLHEVLRRSGAQDDSFESGEWERSRLGILSFVGSVRREEG